MPSASRVNWAKFRVLVVSTVATMILLTLCYLLTGGTVLQPKAMIYLYVPDATGLDKDSPVLVDGIAVGKVANVELSGQNNPDRVVRVAMRVERERLTAITTDSLAEIDSDGLIGDKYVAITSRQSTGHIQPNGEIQMKPPSDAMKTLDLPQLEAQLKNIQALLTDIEGGKSEVAQAVLGDQIYSNLRNSIGRIQSAFHAAVRSTSALGDALYNDRLYHQINDPMVKLDQALAAVQSGQGAGGALLRDTAQYESLIKDVRDLRASIAQVRGGEWMQSDEMYRDWTRTLASFIQQVDRLNAVPLLNSTALYESLTGMARETAGNLKDFRVDPRKYMRLKIF
jgi:phospholipid/cholesterol/gamma-HCH transport system substrate-binding protein